MDEQASPPSAQNRAELPTLTTSSPWNWDAVLSSELRADLAAILKAAIPTRRWFGAKTRQIDEFKLLDVIALDEATRLALVRIQYTDDASDVYQIPFAYADQAAAGRLLNNGRVSAWAWVRTADGGGDGLIYDPLTSGESSAKLLQWFDASARIEGASGSLAAERTEKYAQLRGTAAVALAARPLQAEQSNSSIAFDERLILKIFRRVETGLNPDLEISRYLTARNFTHTPPLAGALTYTPKGEEPWALGILQGFVANRGDAWQHTLGRLHAFLAGQGASGANPQAIAPAEGGLYAAARQALPPNVRSILQVSLDEAELLARRTAEMHLALAAEGNDAAFVAEPFTAEDRRGFVDRWRRLTEETMRLLEQTLPKLAGDVRQTAAAVLHLQPTVEEKLQLLSEAELDVKKIRVHGDYHLGQVLATDDDFVIIDFEGEPARSLSERRLKQLALRDVAGMIRSYHYASGAAANTARTQGAGTVRGQELAALVQGWYFWTSVAFLAEYRRITDGVEFLPAEDEQFKLVLDACLLEKAIYELRYELNNRPDWVYLPLGALVELLQSAE